MYRIIINRDTIIGGDKLSMAARWANKKRIFFFFLLTWCADRSPARRPDSPVGQSAAGWYPGRCPTGKSWFIKGHCHQSFDPPPIFMIPTYQAPLIQNSCAEAFSHIILISRVAVSLTLQSKKSTFRYNYISKIEPILENASTCLSVAQIL